MPEQRNPSSNPTTPAGPASAKSLNEAREATAGQAAAGGVDQGGPDKTNPDLAGGQVLPTMGDNGPVAGQMRGQGAKMVGGGLDAGTTDFGPSTAATHGGRGAAGSSTSRTDDVGAGGGSVALTGGQAGGPGPGEAPGNVSGFGTGTLATGRPTQVDSRQAIGAAAVSGDPGRAARDLEDPTAMGVAGPARTGAGTTSVGTRGGGLAGTPAVANDRAEDAVTGRHAGPEGDVAGTGNMSAGTEPGATNLHFDDANNAVNRQSAGA